MRRLAFVFLGLPFLPGCFLFPSGAASQVKEVPPELKRTRVVAPPVADRHLYGDVTRLEVGQWARYREGEVILTLAAVGKGADGLWIEVIEEGNPRIVSARLVGPGGVVKKAFYGEVAGEAPVTVVPQTLRQRMAPPSPALQEISRETIEEKVTVGARELLVRGIRVRLEDLEGRLLEEVSFWHGEVPPVYAGSDLGGLVRRRAGSLRVDLLDFGSDASPLLKVPR